MDRFFPRRAEGLLKAALTLAFLACVPIFGQLPPFTILDGESSPGISYLGVEGSPFDSAGAALAGGMDVNGDKLPDALAGAPGLRGGASGRAFLILSKRGRPSKVILPEGDGIVTITGGGPGPDRLGAAVALAGDLDGDGLSEFLVGAPSAFGGGAARGVGAACLIFGRTTFPARVNLASDLREVGVVFESSADESLGSAVAGVGDLNGDGKPDFAIGAAQATVPDGGGPGGPGVGGSGRVYVIFGGRHLRELQEHDGRVDVASLGELGFAINGPSAGGLLGSSLAGGDLDGDKISDLMMGAPGAGPGGSVFVLFGRNGLEAGPDLSRPDGEHVIRVAFAESGARLGAALASGRDATGDGLNDILIGAPGVRRDDAPTGLAVLLAGVRVRGAPSIDATSPRAGVMHFLGGRDDLAGSSVDLAPDTGGDGTADIIIGAPGARGRHGAAYVINGGLNVPLKLFLGELEPPAGATLVHNGAGASAGAAVAGLGDRNGDGRGDLAVGAPGAVNDRSPAGAIYEVLVPIDRPPGEAPRELTCDNLSGNRALLKWILGGEYDSLQVLRDGELLVDLPGDKLFFIDASPLAGEHSYVVRANNDPRLVSRSCRIILKTVPVSSLSCEQLPGTTKVVLHWRLADRYPRLAVSVNGKTLREDLPGEATSFQFDPGPGLVTVAVFDPAQGPASGAKCELRVVPVFADSITGLNCVVSLEGEKRVVDLKWDPNPLFKTYLVVRGEARLEEVFESEYRDPNPPSGNQKYQVIGLADIHPSPPAFCEVEVPSVGGMRVRGRVVFEDRVRTPIGRGRINALDARRQPVGEGQPDDGGRFEVPTEGAPSSLSFVLELPRMADADPLLGHRIAVEVSVDPDGDTEILVPLPVLAVVDFRGGPAVWKDLLSAIEAHQAPNGMARGALAFGITSQGELGRAVESIRGGVERLQLHLGRLLLAKPKQIDLVAHGLAGLAARVYLHGLPDGGSPVRSLVLLGSPNLGTHLAGLDAHAASPKRSQLAGGEGRVDDPFTAAVEQFPGYAGDFNRRFTNVRGARVHLIGGLGGADALDEVLGCGEHDGRVCLSSAHGGLPGAALYTTGDTHEGLGRSAGSIRLIQSILFDKPGGGGEALAPAGAGGAFDELRVASGQVYASILDPSNGGELQLLSDTSGSIIIILNNELPGTLFFRVRTPDGVVIDPASAGGLPGVGYSTFGDGEGHQVQSYEFNPGQVGTYTAMISNIGGGSVPYSLQIYLDSTLTLSSELSPAEVSIGEATAVKAAVALNGTPIVNATVEAQVQEPDGDYRRVTLRDDGQAPDSAAGDGSYAGLLDDTPEAGLYLVTVRASSLSPFPFLREASEELVVRSDAAAISGPFTAGTSDLAGDGTLDGLWVQGAINANEGGNFLVTGSLTDLAGNPVAQAGVMFTLPARGPASYQIFFEGVDIFAAHRPGPYLLKEVELLDGNRGFILCERAVDALTTPAIDWQLFGATPLPRFVRGDSNGDGDLDLSDALSVLESLFIERTELPCPDAADANADRSIDIGDAVYLLNALFLDGRPIPPPYPGCGSAPVLGCPRYSSCP